MVFELKYLTNVFNSAAAAANCVAFEYRTTGYEAVFGMGERGRNCLPFADFVRYTRRNFLVFFGGLVARLGVSIMVESSSSGVSV